MASLNPIAAAAGGATPSSFNSSKVSRWSDLSYDLVVCIVSRLSSVDLIVGVSSVCSSWRAAARDRQCWRILDLSDWDYVSARVVDRVSFNQVLNRVLGFVRECDFIEEVYLPPVADEQDLCLVSQRLPKLLYLSFPRSEIPELTAYFALTKFESLKGIEVHKRFFLKPEMILISSLRLPEVFELKLLCENPLGNYIAKMICNVFPKLRKLEMPQLLEITSRAIVTLFDSLEHLEYLDISGCKTLRIDERVIEKASRLKVFIWHGMKT